MKSQVANAKQLSVFVALAGACLAGDAAAQQQMHRVTEAPVTPPAPAAPVSHAVTRVAPASAPAIPPGPPGKPSSAAAVVVPSPSTNAGRLAPNPNYVPFPTGMTNTLDPKVCTAHAGFSGGLGCTAGLPKGMLALVWDCAKCNVDGYRLFRVDAGHHDPIAIPANGAGFTAALLDAPQGGFGSKCYAIQAYRGTYESALSNAYCAGGASVITMATDTFSPDHVRSSTAAARAKNGPPVYSTENALHVGATHFAYKMAMGDDWANTISRGALHFDLARLSKKHIFSATLHVNVDTSSLDKGAIDHSTSCASAFAMATDTWWSHTDWILTQGQHDESNGFGTASRLQPGSADGPDATYDVTPIVADWAQGTPNLGVVVLTEDAGINGFSDNGCSTKYTGAVTLEVKSY